MSIPLSEKSRALADGGLAWGATNSGKTFGNASHFAKYAARHPGKHLMIGPNLRLLRGEVIPDVRSIARHYGVRSTDYSTSTGTFTVGKSQIIVVAGSKQGDEDRLRTYHNVLSLLGEELPAMLPDFWDMGVSRMKTPLGPRWGSCNPAGPTNWVKKRLDDGRWGVDRCFFVKDNPVLTPEQVEEFESQFTGVFKQRMIDAVWAAAEGLVYPYFMLCKDGFDKSRPYLLLYDPAPVNTQAALALQPFTDYWAVVGEIYTRRGATQRDAREALDNIEDKFGKPFAAVIDPAAYDHVFEATYYKRWNVLAPSTKEHKITVPILRLLLEQGRIRVNPSLAPNLCNELYSVVYDEKTEKIATVVNGVKQDDHATDALRYGSEFIEAEIIPRVITPGNQFMREWDMQYANR